MRPNSTIFQEDAMIDPERICPSCTGDNAGERICPLCGFDCESKNPPETLSAKTILLKRFFVGKAVSRDSEGITYIGYDAQTESSVDIKEYYPAAVAVRNEDGSVACVPESKFSYNEGLMEFLEINRTLSEEKLPATVAVLAVFEENGTAYCVTEKINGITLAQFLEKNGNTLKWEQARPLFLPLVDTLIALQQKRIFVLGISPQTITVGRDARLRFSSICVRSSRCVINDVKPRLFDGYSALEQYGFEDLSVGAYTDVYGLSATLFRTLIGMVPPSATDRVENDGMTIPARFADELPRQVLVALANGLQVMPESRTSCAETFKNELVYGEAQENARKAALARKAARQAELEKEVSSDSKREESIRKQAEKQEKKERPVSPAKYAVISAACTAGFFLLIALVLCLTVFRGSVFKTSTSTNESSQDKMPSVASIGDVDKDADKGLTKLYHVPSFVGKYYSQIASDEEYENLEFVITGKQYSDKVARGAVVSQSVAAESDVAKGTKVELVISLGPKQIKIANVIGQTKDAAVLELLKQGFIYDNITVEEKYDSTKKPGVVLSQTPKYGSSVNTEIGITIYVNSYTGDQE